MSTKESLYTIKQVSDYLQYRRISYQNNILIRGVAKYAQHNIYVTSRAMELALKANFQESGPLKSRGGFTKFAGIKYRESGLQKLIL